MNRKIWKSGTRIDTIMAILVVAFALGVLGVGAIESGPAADHQAAAKTTHWG